MSVKFFKLVVGDKIVFGGEVVREITDIKESTNLESEKGNTYILDGDLALNECDPLWDLAELIERPGFPLKMQTAQLDCIGNYIDRPFCWTPKQLLRALCEDIATLKAAGVKEEK